MNERTPVNAETENEDAAARGLGWAILFAAILMLTGNCLLNCPSRFSERHYEDTSLLRPIVDTLGLWGRWPTLRGVEIRNLIFHCGAATVLVLAGLKLAVFPSRTRMSLDDVLDVRDRLGSPYLWWIVLIAVSWLSSRFSHAPDVCQGPTIQRLLHLAWWWPIAAMLSARQLRTLATALVAVLGVTSAVALLYHQQRVMPFLPGARLQYPLGNELWLAACLLPGAMVGGGLLAARIYRPATLSAGKARQRHATSSGNSRLGGLGAVFLLLAVGAIVLALFMTRSRSAAAGAVAGAMFGATMLVSRKRRAAMILVMLVAGIGAALVVQYWRTAGATAQRAHSIRARLNYEWPYALRMFMDKPVCGHGDGAYALLAGQFAREDQLDDPNVLRFDERTWPGHAHHEILETMSDLGAAGTLALLLAMGIPLYRALRHCDARADDPGAAGERLLVAGLSGALVASLVEACGTPAIREPGTMPLVLTTWAMLWGLVRPIPNHEAAPAAAQPSEPADEDERPISPVTVRIFGVAVAAAGAALAHQGIMDWHAVRARMIATELVQRDEYVEAAVRADFAARHTLDPFQCALAALLSVECRVRAFDAILARSFDAPTEAQMEISSDALARLHRLQQIAPRFLRVSFLVAELELNRARAFERRGEPVNEAQCRRQFLLALRQAREDEPFLMERVQQLWQLDGGASLADRIQWLRCLLRGGEVDARFDALAASLRSMAGANAALDRMLFTARHDAAAPPERWEDRLTPESFRLAGMCLALGGSFEDAQEVVKEAIVPYEAARQRLFAGYGAALHEMVRYRLLADPSADPEKNLEQLAEAYSIAYGPLPKGASDGDILPDASLGRTRALVLLAMGDKAAAAKQLAAIHPRAEAPIDRELAGLYLHLAEICLLRGGERLAEKGLTYCGRAAELQPDLSDALGIRTLLLLELGREDEAAAALAAFEASASSEAVENLRRRIRDRYPDSSVLKDSSSHPVDGARN